MILLKKKKCCESPPEDVWCRQGSVDHKQGHSPGVCSWTQLGITAPNVDVAGYERKCQSWLGTNQKRETWGCPGNATTATSWLSLGTSMSSMREDTSHSHGGTCLWAPRVHQRQGEWSQWRVKTGAALSFRKHNLCLRDSCKLCNPPAASVCLLGTPEYLHCLENTYLSFEPNFNGPSAKPQA